MNMSGDPTHHYPDCCAHQVFEREAAASSNSTGIIFGAQALTYGELNARANQLARYLGRSGIGREVLAGVFFEPCMEAAITALAVLKTGGVLVFLPVTNPEELLKEMIADSGLTVLLTNSNLAKRVALPYLKTICVDAVAARVASESRENLDSGVCPGDAAYVRFSSGSTGKPKGVINIHRSLTARLTGGPLPDLRRGDVCSLNATQGLTLRLIMPLACGATVVILQEDETRDPRRFAYALEKNQITSIYAVPSLLRQVLALGPEILRRLRHLRVVTVGGEVLGPDLAELFLKALPGTLLLNAYGSNEAGGMVTLRAVSVRGLSNSRSIGLPVANTQIHILDENLMPVPAGDSGEIYVGSGHLARGYLNRPDLTAQAFVTDPFSRNSDERLFRTGDLGRYLPNGEIEFAGRADRQVKVHGFRVELDEIEAVLVRAPNVQEAAVTAEATGPDRRLIAYVVEAPGTSLRQSNLRRFLGTRLPAHMVPAVFVTLAAIPHTTTGKVDRKSLPPPSLGRPGLDSPYERPRTPVDAILSEIWASVLQLDRVGIHDNFLELGGDSLMAAQIISEICGRFDIEISLESFFEFPTVADLADCIDSSAQPDEAAPMTSQAEAK